MRKKLSVGLKECFQVIFLESGGIPDDIEGYATQALMNKIKERFKEKITISLYDHRRGNFLYSSALTESDARESVGDSDEKHVQVIRTAALYLR